MVTRLNGVSSRMKIMVEAQIDSFDHCIRFHTKISCSLRSLLALVAVPSLADLRGVGAQDIGVT